LGFILGATKESKMIYLGQRFKLRDQLPQVFSNLTHAIVSELKVNSIVEETVGGRSVFVKNRHLHGVELTALANFFFQLCKIPIRFQSNCRDWRRWEMKCFKMLNGDRFHIWSPDERTVIEEKLPGKTIWHHVTQGTLTPRMLQATAAELHRAHQLWSDEFQGPWSHGDATMENVVYDPNTDRARLIDFEIVHADSMSATARQADDLLVFLLDMAGTVSRSQWLPLALCFLQAYGDEKVIAKLTKRFALFGGLGWIWWEIRSNFTSPARLRRRLSSLRIAVTKLEASEQRLREGEPSTFGIPALSHV
jgi:hypothetical protein